MTESRLNIQRSMCCTLLCNVNSLMFSQSNFFFLFFRLYYRVCVTLRQRNFAAERRLTNGELRSNSLCLRSLFLLEGPKVAWNFEEINVPYEHYMTAAYRAPHRSKEPPSWWVFVIIYALYGYLYEILRIFSTYNCQISAGSPRFSCLRHAFDN